MKMKHFVALAALAASPEMVAEAEEGEKLQPVVDSQSNDTRTRTDQALFERGLIGSNLDEILTVDMGKAVLQIFGDLSPKEIVDYAQEKIDVLAKAEKTMDKKDPRFEKVTQLLAQFKVMQVEAKKILTTTLTEFGYTAEQITLLEKEFGNEGLEKAMAHGKKDPGLNNWLKMMIAKKDDPKFYAVAKQKAEAQLEAEIPMTSEEIAARDARIAQLQAENAQLQAKIAQNYTEIVNAVDPTKK